MIRKHVSRVAVSCFAKAAACQSWAFKTLTWLGLKPTVFQNRYFITRGWEERERESSGLNASVCERRTAYRVYVTYKCKTSRWWSGLVLCREYSKQPMTCITISLKSGATEEWYSLQSRSRSRAKLSESNGRLLSLPLEYSATTLHWWNSLSSVVGRPWSSCHSTRQRNSSWYFFFFLFSSSFIDRSSLPESYV